MLPSYPRPRLRAGILAVAVLGLLALVTSPVALAATPGTFTTRASSPNPVNNVAVNPKTNIIYAQQYGGTGFYSYNPATNKWTTLTSSPVAQGNNGGGAYLNGKIYTVYTENGTQMGVYDIATGTWKTVANPLGAGTGNITAVGGLLYLVGGTSFVSYDPATNKTKTLANAPGFSDTTDQFGGTPYCAGSGFQAWGGLAPYKGKLYGTQGDGCNGFAIYDIASNKWTEQPLVPGYTVLGGAIDPVTGTYYAYGGYGQNHFFAYDIATKKWSKKTFPFSSLDDGGLAYVSAPGLQGIYAGYGQESTGFTRFNTQAGARVSISEKASPRKVTVGGSVTYTLKVRNSGSTIAPGVKATDKLSSAVKLTKVSTTKGKCSGTTRIVCKLGDLKAGHSVTIKITVTTRRKGEVKNTSAVTTTALNTSSHVKASSTVKVVGKSTSPTFTG